LFYVSKKKKNERWFMKEEFFCFHIQAMQTHSQTHSSLMIIWNIKNFQPSFLAFIFFFVLLNAQHFFAVCNEIVFHFIWTFFSLNISCYPHSQFLRISCIAIFLINNSWNLEKYFSIWFVLISNWVKDIGNKNATFWFNSVANFQEQLTKVY